MSRLYSRTLAILGKDVEHLLALVVAQKLTVGESRALVNYVRLLDELHDIEERVKAETEKRMGKIPTADLRARAKELLKKEKAKGGK